MVAALDQDTSYRVFDKLTAPPADNKYAALQERLLTTFGLSKYKRAFKLHHLHLMGDLKPSEVMDEMSFFAGY